MNRENDILTIYRQNIPRTEKLRLLHEMELDLKNELEAQEQNMQPKIHENISEALRLTHDLIRNLNK